MGRALLGALVAAAIATVVGVPPAVGGRAASLGDDTIVRTLLLSKTDLPAGFKDNGAVASNRCFSPAGSGMTVKAESSQYEQVTSSTDTALQSSAALYRSHAAAAAVFQKLYSSKTAPNCAYAAFRKELPKRDKVSHFRLIPIRTSIGTLRISVWDVRLQLTVGKSTAPVEIAVTGYLRGRALSQLLVAAVGANQSTVDVAKTASAMVTARLRRAHL